VTPLPLVLLDHAAIEEEADGGVCLDPVDHSRLVLGLGFRV